MLGGKNIIVWAAIAGGAIIAVVAGIYFLWYGEGETATVPEPRRPLRPAARPTPTPTAEELRSERLIGVNLSTSDEVTRELVAELSSHPKLVEWLAHEDLVRRFTASVANIAEGKSPRAHLDFLRPSEPFTVLEKRGDYIVDPASYERYNLVTGIFASLNTEAAVRLYRELEPIINEAYQEIAPPNRRFRSTLMQAIQHLLKVPIIEDDVYLKEKVVTYEMLNEELEGLSDAQRQLLRMGPHNVRIIQQKLTELETALRRPPDEPVQPEAVVDR